MEAIFAQNLSCLFFTFFPTPYTKAPTFWSKYLSLTKKKIFSFWNMFYFSRPATSPILMFYIMFEWLCQCCPSPFFMFYIMFEWLVSGTVLLDKLCLSLLVAATDGLTSNYLQQASVTLYHYYTEIKPNIARV